MWYSLQRTLTQGTSTSQTHTAHVVQSATNSHEWDKYITDTHIPCGTVRNGLSRMGQVHHRHTHPMWYSLQWTLTHETSTSQTHTSNVVQSATESHVWNKYITDTHIPCGTVYSGLSRMRQVHHRHTHPMWYSPQRTLPHGTSASQTHTAHVVQSATNSHAWDEYITDTHLMWFSLQRTLTHGTSTSQIHTSHVIQSATDSHAWDKYISDTHIPCGTVYSGLSRMRQVHHRHTQPMWYSPQRTLTHGISTSQTHTSHVVQSATDSHAWDKYITDTHIPCGTVRNGLSRMGQVHHRHTHIPCGTVRNGLSRMGQVHHRHTHPMWYSPQRTLTHGTSTSQTHTSHVVQSATDSHAWDKYITDTHIPCGTVRNGLSRMGQVHHRHTHIPCGTVRNGLSRMGQVHHRHTHPMWYSPQRTLTHGTSTSQTHTSHVVQSATDSHAWDKCITDTHIPCGTVYSGLSRMRQVHHRHTHPMWYSLQRTLTQGTSTSQTHTAHVVQSATNSHEWDKYITDTHIPCGTVRNGLSRMGQVHHRHTHPMWYSLQWTLTHETSTSQTHTSNVVQSTVDSHA